MQLDLLLFLLVMQAINSLQLRSERALLFDIDGTLSDSFRLGFESTQRVLAANGYRTINDEEYHQGT